MSEGARNCAWCGAVMARREYPGGRESEVKFRRRRFCSLSCSARAGGAARVVGPDTPLTGRQREVYRWLLAFVLHNGTFPTVRELCRHMGAASPNAGHGHLRVLERKGYLRRVRGHLRSGGAPCLALAGVTLEPVFQDSEAGRRARAAWEGGARLPAPAVDGEGGAA